MAISLLSYSTNNTPPGSFALPSGTNRYVTLYWYTTNSTVCGTVTYNGSTMTKIVESRWDPVATAIYGLAIPDEWSAGTYSFAGVSGANRVQYYAFGGVDPDNPIVDSDGGSVRNAGGIIHTLSTVNGSYLCGIAYTANAGGMSVYNGNQTIHYNGITRCIGIYSGATGANIAFGWSWSTASGAQSVISMRPAVPKAFSLISPANGATGQSKASTTISWGASKNATSYYYTLNGGGSWTNVGNVTSKELTGLAAGTTYTWGIIAQGDSGAQTAATGNYRTFTTLPVPGAFNKSTPSSGATAVAMNASNQVALTWGASSNASSYQYKISTSSGGGTWTTASSGVLVTLSHNTTYYWNVQALNASGTTISDGGTQWSFTTEMETPAAFNKSAPSNGAITQPINPTLSWDGSTNAQTYYYRYSTTPGGGSWISNGANTSVALSGLTLGATYYWQVYATNNSGDVVYANSNTEWNFSIGTVPTAPTDAHTDSKTDTQIVMHWTDNSVDETGFKIYKNDVYIETIAAGSVSYTYTGLTELTQYDLAVKATNAFGDSAEAQLTETTNPSGDTHDGAVTLSIGSELIIIGSITHQTVDAAVYIDVLSELLAASSISHQTLDAATSIDVSSELLAASSVIHQILDASVSIEVHSSLISVDSILHQILDGATSINVSSELLAASSVLHQILDAATSIDVSSELLAISGIVHQTLDAAVYIDVLSELLAASSISHQTLDAATSIDVSSELLAASSVIHQILDASVSIEVHSSLISVDSILHQILDGEVHIQVSSQLISIDLVSHQIIDGEVNIYVSSEMSIRHYIQFTLKSDARTYIIAFEYRTSSILYEDRISYIQFEDRMYSIESENRIEYIQNENRMLVVT